MVEESWPDYHPEIPEYFEKSIEGYNLALRLWNTKLNDLAEPIESDVNGWEPYIDYAEDYALVGKSSLKIGVHSKRADECDTFPGHQHWILSDDYPGKKFISFDNVGVLLGMATDYYKTGRTALSFSKIKE